MKLAAAALSCAALLLGASACANNKHAKDPSKQERVELDAAASSGKLTAPIAVRIRYPTEHPLNQPLPVEVELWATDGAASTLTAAARLPPGVDWAEGDKEARFEGPIAEGEKRTYRFTVIPREKGELLLNVDVSRVREGDAAARNLVVMLRGGGKLDREGLPPGAKLLPPVME